MTDILKDSLEKRIAGEVVLSDQPGKEMRKWRKIFKISQKDLSNEMDVSPSVISDYESLRRTPGAEFIKSFIHSLISLDEERGSEIIDQFSSFEGPDIENSILDMKNFAKEMDLLKLLNKINAEVKVGKDFLKKKTGGYMVIDSKKAVLSLTPKEISKIHNLSLDKTIIFTDTRSGKTIMTAVKIMGMKPDIVVLQGTGKNIDEIAIRIAETQKIPIAVCNLASVDDVLEKLGDYQ